MDVNLAITIIQWLYFFNLVGAIITVFREPRDISATWAWLLVLVMLPVVGFILYSFFGRKMSKKRIFDIQSQEALGVSQIAESQLGSLADTVKATPISERDSIELARLFLQSEESIITKGNQIDVITDGKEKFDRLEADLKNAKQHIHLTYYIFKDDYLGKRIMKILIERAKAGVEVLVIYDALGSKATSQEFWAALEQAGGKVFSFFPDLIPFINLTLNYRSHRKIVVIDGVIGYVGGFNIGDEYLGIKEMGYWRDTHLRIEGNAVLTLQTRFFMDWNAVANKEEHREYLAKYFPISERKGNSTMQIVSNGPDTDYEIIKKGFIKMISMARESVYIQTPYFIPDEAVFEALTIAALSGVKVNLMIPCKPDHAFVYRATEFYAKSVLDSGVKVYLYENGFIHAKTVVIDGKIATVGTSNFDVRSFKLNFEINAFIYDQKIAQQLVDNFKKDIEQSLEATQEYFDNQSTFIKFKQTFSRLFAPIL